MQVESSQEQNSYKDNEHELGPGALLESAHRAAQVGDLDAAQLAYEQALSADPDLQEAWLGLAGLTTDLMFAHALYERVLQKWPDCELARMALAHLDAEGGLRNGDDADRRVLDPLEAAARAGAPLYRGAHADDGIVTPPDPMRPKGNLKPHAPRRRMPGASIVAPWIYPLCALTVIILLVAATLAWRPWHREVSDDVPRVAESTPAGSPVASESRVVSDHPGRLATLHPWARRHLAFVPPDRAIEIDLSQGMLVAYEQGQALRTIPVGAPRVLAPGTGSCIAATASQVHVAPAGPLGSLAGCPRGAAWLYALDLAREDAEWLSNWLDPQSTAPGQLFVMGQRVLIALD